MKKLLLTFLLLISISSFSQTLGCSEGEVSILMNPSFENGEFGNCWISNGETTILENLYDGDFSIQVIGNVYIQQTFNPVSVSSLLSASFVAYRPETSPMAVWWDYSNGTSGDTFFNDLSSGWNTIDILSELDSNLELVTITAWGYSGGGGEGDTTVFDSFNFCSDINNYESLCGEYGCADETACNYNPESEVDDGSCIYPNECGSCEENLSCLCPEDLIAQSDTMLCKGDTISIALLSEFTQNDFLWSTGDNSSTIIVSPNETTIYSVEMFADLDSDGIAESLCVDEVTIVTEDCGCMDIFACNYCWICSFDDGSCLYAEAYYDCDGNCVNDLDNDQVCDEIDNCPEDYNPNQEDFNSDDIGDACDGIGLVEENLKKKLIKVIDLLGRETTNKDFNIEIYDDGTVGKKYRIK